MVGNSDDIAAIRALIARQFESLNWSPGIPADWEGFAGDFAPEAALYPAARPARRQSVAEFVSRMKGLADGKLRTFHEKLLGAEVRVFGNVAVACAACEITENGADLSRNVEMLLLIKDGSTWKIVAQGWDSAGLSRPVPHDLLPPD